MLKNLSLQLFDQEFKQSLDRLKSRQKALNEARQAYIIDQVATAGRIYAIKNQSLQLFDQEFKLRHSVKDAYIEKCTNN